MSGLHASQGLQPQQNQVRSDGRVAGDSVLMVPQLQTRARRRKGADAVPSSTSTAAPGLCDP